MNVLDMLILITQVLPLILVINLVLGNYT